jgi:queuine tRNA-ribosyltransferase
MTPIRFSIVKKITSPKADRNNFDSSNSVCLGRAGLLETNHGTIETPAFVVVGTKATVKGITPEMLKDTGAQVMLANTYHLYLQPGDELVAKAGGLEGFSNWHGPTMTDSGGFQVFSLGTAFGKNITKFAKGEKEAVLEMPRQQKHRDDIDNGSPMKPAQIDANGVMFRSVIDGGVHYFTPQKSVQIQHNLGADMIFAFDECTSPQEPFAYQAEALDRTHRWAKESLLYHLLDSNGKIRPESEKQALFGIVQGGRSEQLRKESAEVLKNMVVTLPDGRQKGFDGFGIGGSFAKEDMTTAVEWVNSILPEDKPRHLLGIGEAEDLFEAVEKGCDLFDCVMPTRNGRTGTLLTRYGKINISNAKYRDDFSKVEDDCLCYTCQNFTRAYLSHLFRAKEMLGGTLATIHNIFFTVQLVKKIRQSILDDCFFEYKREFLSLYIKK